MNLKKMGGCVGKYKKYVIATPLLVIGEVALEVIMPMLVGWLIDEIDPTKGGAGSIRWVVIYGAIIIGMSVVSLIFGALAGKTAAIGSTGFACNLRQTLYARIQGFSFSNLDRFSTASLVTRLTTDVTNVQSAFQMLTRMTFRAPIMLVFASVMSFVLNWKLALIFIAAVPIIILCFGLIIKKTFPYFDEMFKKYDKLNAVTEENLTGIRVVKSYVREEHEVEKFEKASQAVRNFSKRAQALMALAGPVMTFVMYGVMLCLYWFGGNQIIFGEMKIGGLTAFMTYGMQILTSLMMVAVVFVMLVMARASAVRISQVLDEESDIVSPVDAVAQVDDGSIEFDNVSFDYDTTDDKDAVLKNVNLRIRSGQTIGILGGTGSSKTTMVQLIPRLYDTTVGTVKVGGRDVREYDLKTLRDAVAVVLQKNVLFSGTIEENLRWGDLEATQQEIEAACRHAQAHDFISSFPDGYQTDLGQGGVNVSGGQKQRLCIARALLKHPKVIILDDSTSAVDTKTDALIRRALREELGDVTKVIIAQRVASVEDADQIIVLEDGQINDVGTHDELLKRCKIYQEVHHSQTKGKEANNG